MSYLPDYITWRGDLPFAADPANDLDTLVMAALSYIDLPAETQVFAQCAKSVPPDDPDDHFRGRVPPTASANREKQPLWGIDGARRSVRPQ